MATLAVVATAATAQPRSFPDKPVTIVVPFPPGGTADLLARTLGQKVSEAWKQPVVIDSRTGASGIIGSQFVAHAAPDGYTLMVVPMTHATNPSMFAKLPYDTMADFTPLSLLAIQPLLLVVNPALPVHSVADLVALAKRSPGKYNCGSGGNGTSQHLACELFKSTAKVDLRHVPYRGNALAMTDVMGGQVEVMFDQLATAIPHVKAGKVRALGVSTARRSPALPDVPTIAEAGLPGYDATAWFALLGPGNMPAPLANQISAAFRHAMYQPEVQRSLSSQGIDLDGSSPADFRQYLKGEIDKWGVVIKQSGMQPN